MTMRIGFDVKLYRSTTLLGVSPALTADVATWALVPKTKDMSLSVEPTMIPTSNRSSIYETETPGMLKVPIELEMDYDTADADLIALNAAAWGRTPVALMHADGDATVTGASCFGANWNVQFNQSEPLNGELATKFKLSINGSALKYTKGT